MRDSGDIRPIGKLAQPTLRTDIIRVRGAMVSIGGSPALANVRLAWTGSGYAVTNEVITFYEDSGLAPKSLDEGEETFVVWRPAAGRYEEIGSSTQDEAIVHFELMEDMAYADIEKLAKPIGVDATTIWAAPSFYVIDQLGQFYGKGDSDPFNEIFGYHGHAVKITDNWNSTGVPGYRIIDMEGPKHLVVGTLAGSYSLGGTPFAPSAAQPWGRPSRGRRLPDTGNMTVFDDLNVAAAASSGDKWLVAWDEASEYYIFIVPLTQSENFLFRFETTAAKDWSAASVAGKLLDGSDGDLLTGVTLADRAPAKHEAQIGSRGWCVHSGAGTTYWIVTMDSPARWIEGDLNADWALSAASATIVLSDFWGASPNHLEPESSSVTIYDDLMIRSRKVFAGETLRAVWDEKRKKYYLAAPPTPYITIKGTSPGVTRATSTFTLGSPVAVNGNLPSGTITVTNSPPLDSPSGRTIFARFNTTVGTTLLDAWDTGDMGNFLEALRGLADYNQGTGGIPQLIDHDATGESDPHWHDTGPCDPPA